MSDQNTRSDPESSFTYGVRELRTRAPPDASRATAPSSGERSAGVDPYNTSGNFDRKKNWMGSASADYGAARVRGSREFAVGYQRGNRRERAIRLPTS